MSVARAFVQGETRNIALAPEVVEQTKAQVSVLCKCVDSSVRHYEAEIQRPGQKAVTVNIKFNPRDPANADPADDEAKLIQEIAEVLTPDPIFAEATELEAGDQ